MPPKHKIIPYNHKLTTLARDLRKNMTLSEVLLWNELKGGRMLGYDFTRQKPLDEYIVDFYCRELSLAIEIDGDSHHYIYEDDIERQTRLESLGVRFIRFYDIEVKRDINNVLWVIEDWIRQNSVTESKPSPSPSQGGDPIITTAV